MINDICQYLLLSFVIIFNINKYETYQVICIIWLRILRAIKQYYGYIIYQL
jgi:hypothetical protein